MNMQTNIVAAPTSVTSRLATITPEMAVVMLEKNTQNRTIRQSHVDALVKELKEGRWALNGDAIRIDLDGVLLDGQHRLWACVNSDVPIQTFVVEGLPREVMATIDGNKPRTGADQLKLFGEINTALLASTLRLMVGIASKDPGLPVSRGELQLILGFNPGVRETVSKATRIKKVAPSLIGVIHYVGSVFQGKPAEAEAFMEVMVTGVPAYPGCPAHLLRERLLETKRGASRLTLVDNVDLHVHTWNNFTQKKPLTKLQQPKSKPELVGLTLHNLRTQH